VIKAGYAGERRVITLKDGRMGILEKEHFYWT